MQYPKYILCFFKLGSDHSCSSKDPLKFHRILELVHITLRIIYFNVIICNNSKHIWTTKIHV